jgi:hypothetical protein
MDDGAFFDPETRILVFVFAIANIVEEAHEF